MTFLWTFDMIICSVTSVERLPQCVQSNRQTSGQNITAELCPRFWAYAAETTAHYSLRESCCDAWQQRGRHQLTDALTGV